MKQNFWGDLEEVAALSARLYIIKCCAWCLLLCAFAAFFATSAWLIYTLAGLALGALVMWIFAALLPPEKLLRQQEDDEALAEEADYLNRTQGMHK